MLTNQFVQTLWGENRTKIVLLILLLFTLGALQLWQGFMIEPSLESARLELRKVTTDLSQLRQRIDEGGGAKTTGKADDLESFYQIIPPRTGLGGFIGQLYSYAETTGIDIDQISYAAKSVEETDLLGYNLKFKVSGSYAQVKKFIHKLENSPSLLILNKISLAGASQVAGENVNLQMELQTFFRESER